MIKFYIRTIAAFLVGISLFSCERGELLNAEADIIEVVLPTGMKAGKPIITNDKVRIPNMTTNQADSLEFVEQLKSLTLKFELTPGATISDEGIQKDFNQPQQYTVTSEDGEWQKTYDIIFYVPIFEQYEFDFTYFEPALPPSKPFYIFYEVDTQTGVKQYVWDSGNIGFAMTAGTQPADAYPTTTTLNGKTGTGAKLVTRSTGYLGSKFRMPIAAGNLFLGYFNINDATSKPLEATQFGVPTIMDNPKEITLWCKYQAGTEYKDKKGNILNIVDYPEIYAVLYEPEKDENGNPIKLNGTNIRTASNIISLAVMNEEHVKQIRVNDIENDDYKYISIPFEQKGEFDVQKQKQGLYYITIVFSSSAKGNLFEGAVGSTLCIDEVTFVK
ncbi:hypothetical protein D0T49_06325 [Paludibacter sp. 221]|uniref:PCMD domain-containing protein n=1 Tax=Paludibacter sp. 221 TaxID=2302939 RepID=UPI0013D48ACE|nr:PCMD domain-containing protein [Paludibacter sp. 221]NDV46659.1 hypothetical protein [Paludibacter sp. 221]